MLDHGSEVESCCETEGKHGNRLTCCHLQKSLNYRFLRTSEKGLKETAPEWWGRTGQAGTNLPTACIPRHENLRGVTTRFRDHEIYIKDIRYEKSKYDMYTPPVSCNNHSANIVRVQVCTACLHSGFITFFLIAANVKSEDQQLRISCYTTHVFK